MAALARSYLYAPGDRPERYAKAAASGADAVVLDLEDGVGSEAKERARTEVASFVRVPGPQWWVRVGLANLEADIGAAVRAGTRGVMVPEADVGVLDEVDRLLGASESRAGTAPLEVIGLIETPAALRQLDALCRSPRLVRIGIGEADLAAALGMSPDAERRELWSVRSDVVVASAAAGLAAPVGPVETRLGDDAVLRSSTALLARQGFTARTAIHPRQIEPLHRALAPSEDQVRAAQEVVAAFEAAGSGVAVLPDGRMVDLAVVRSARAVLARAGHDCPLTSR